MFYPSGTGVERGEGDEVALVDLEAGARGRGFARRRVQAGICGSNHGGGDNLMIALVGKDKLGCRRPIGVEGASHLIGDRAKVGRGPRDGEEYVAIVEIEVNAIFGDEANGVGDLSGEAHVNETGFIAVGR